MQLDKAHIIDLTEHGAYKPSTETNGDGMPGFQFGHYRMGDRSKAFCLVTDASHVPYLRCAMSVRW